MTKLKDGFWKDKGILSDDYVLLAGGGHMALSSLSDYHNHDSRYLRKDTNDSTQYQYTFSKTNDHAIQIGTIRGLAFGSQTGNYLHIYERVHIGSPNGWGSRNAPTYGLSTYGGAWLATDTGNVGIGTTSPSQKLHISGNTLHNGIVYLANGTTYWIDNSAIGYLNDLRVDQMRLVDNWIGFYQSNNAGGSRYGYIQANGTYMYFVKENGNSGFNFNGNIVPSSTNALDLGTNALRWRTLYVKGNPGINYIMDADTSNAKCPLIITNTSNTQVAEIGYHNTGDTDGAFVITPYAHSGTNFWAGIIGLFIGKNNLKWENKYIARFTATPVDGRIVVASGTIGNVTNAAYTIAGLFTAFSGGTISSSGNTLTQTNHSITIGGTTKTAGSSTCNIINSNSLTGSTARSTSTSTYNLSITSTINGVASTKNIDKLWASQLNLIYCRDDSSPSNKEAWNTIKNGTSNTETNKVQFYTIYGADTTKAPTNHGELLEILSYNGNHWQPQLWFGNGKTGHIYYRNKDYNNDTWGDWRTILDTGNVSPAIGISGNTIRITVGGVNSGYITVPFATNSTNTTNVIVNQNISANADYPIVWSNAANTSTTTANQLYKSYDYLLYNPSTKVLRNDGPLWLRPDRDATLKIYSGKITDGYSDGFICMQTSIDGTDGQSHSYPTSYGARCVIALQPRGGEVYIGKTITAASTYADTTYKLNVDSKAIIQASTLDNTAFRNTLTIFGNNSNESSGENFTEGNASWGIGFKRQWSSGTATGICAGIFCVPSGSWRAGLAFRVKNNTTAANGAHDVTAIFISPRGSLLQQNPNSWLTLAKTQIGRLDGTTYTDRAVIGATNGNLHLDPYSGYSTYINYYNHGNVYFNGTTAYVNTSSYIFAVYFNSAISDENPTIGSVYIRNTSDNYIRRMSLSNFTTQVLSNFGITKDTRRSKNSSNADIESVTGYVLKNKSFIDIWGFAPTATYRTTKDRPAPYGIGFTDGSDSGGIMPVGDSNALKEIRFYGANSGPTHFTFGRMNWESTTYDSDNSNSFSIYTDIDGTNGNMWTSGSVAIGTSSFSDKLRVYGGIIRIDANSVYLRIGPQNGTYAHYETNAGTSHWFNKRIDVNGAIWRYNTNYGIADNGRFYALSMYANRSASGTDGGISLYSTDDPMTYGIAFRSTGSYGKLGRVQGDWATYLTMNNSSQRGWIFRNSSTGAIASISNTGEAFFTSIGHDQIIMYPGGGKYTTGTSSITGALCIKLPVSWTSTMFRFKVNIYNYSTHTSCTYVVGGYNYSSSSSSWVNTFAYSERYQLQSRGNLTVRFGHDGTYCCVYIGETNTTWNYPQVTITEVSLGFGNYDYNRWATGWSISFVTTFGTITGTTITNPAINYHAERASYVLDRTNSTATYVNYGAAGLGWGSITWLTCWNGYELRAISKAEMASVVNVYQHTANNVDYPLVWSNQNNTSTVQANQLHKSYSHLVYNPSAQTLKVSSRITSPYANHTQTSMRHLDAGLNAVNTDHNLYIGYGAQTYTTVTRFYYSTGTTDTTSSRTEFMQINSNGAYALTRFGVNGQNTSYNFYVNGTSYLNGQVYMLMGGRSFSWYSPQQYNASNANPSYYSALCAIININSYSGWFPWIRAVDSEKGTWVIGQYTNQLHIGRIDKANTSNTLTKRWDYSKDGTLLSPNGFRHGEHNNNDAVLLAGGSWTLLSSLSGSHTHPYLPLAGGTMNSNAQIVVGTINNSSGQVYSGGIQLREYQYQTTSVTDNYENAPGITFHWGGRWAHKLNMHSNALYWDNYKIWHDGNDGPGSGLDADTVDGHHQDHLLPYRYTYGAQTNSGSIWYVRIRTADYISEDCTIYVRGTGNNCSSDLVIHVLTRGGRFWGWQTSYNGCRITGISKETGAPEIIYLKMPDTTTSISFKSTHSLTIDKADYSAKSYMDISSEGLFGNYILGRIQYADYADSLSNPGKYYWANLQMQTTANTATQPQFGYVGIGGAVSTSYRLYAYGAARVSGRLYLNEWIEFSTAATGLYWPNANNASHFHPNDATTYGQFVLRGSRGGYSGIQFARDANYMTIMDNSQDKGLYNQSNGVWIYYYRRDANRVGIRTSSNFGADININGTTHIRYSTLDNAAFKNILTIFGNNSNESSAEAFTEANASWGIGFQRQWSSGTATGICAGIFCVPSGSWRAGLAFRVKNNTTASNGAHDVTAIFISPKGSLLQQNYNNWLSPARTQIGRLDTSTYTDRSIIGTTNGNLHIDPYYNANAGTYSTYINYYSNAGYTYFNGSTYRITNAGQTYFAGYHHTAHDNNNAVLLAGGGWKLESALNVDMVDGWHQTNLVWSGYVTSGTASLSSYWFKAWTGTITGYQYNDLDLTFLVASGYNDKRGLIHLKIRQNGANNGGAYNFGKSLTLCYGNIPLADVRLYCNNSTGVCELWMNVVGQYGVYNYTVIKKTWRTGIDITSFGTLTASNFTTAQTVPAISTECIQMSGSAQTGLFWANLSVQTAASNTTVPSFGAIRMNGATSAGTNYITGAAGRIYFGGNFHIDSLGSNATYINYYTANNIYMVSGSSQGKVGIGNNSPSYKLHVTGDSYVTGWSRAASGFYTESGGVYYAHNGNYADISTNGNEMIISGSTTMHINYRTSISGRRIPTIYYWRAGSSSSYAGHEIKYLNLFPQDRSSYGEGIRLHTASNGWTTFAFCGTDNTGDSGTSANTWSMHTNGGNFYLNKNNSSTATVNRIWARTGGGFTFGNTANASYVIESAGDVRTATGWFRSTGAYGWYNDTYSGGWYMTDTTYVRVYNSKAVYTANSTYYAFNAAGGFYGKMFSLNTERYILKPWGAMYVTTSDTHTGAITITLPASIGNTMTSMWIDVYNYSTNTSFSVHVGGYTYNNSTWSNNPFAMVYGANHTVRLGHNGTSFVIYIGETNSTWHYPQVSVRDVILGYSPSFNNWANQWTIGFSTSFSNVTATITHYAYTTKNLNPNECYVTQHTANNVEYPLIWSNQNNTSSVRANQLYKSYANLTYNPANNRIIASRFQSSLTTSSHIAGLNGTNVPFNVTAGAGYNMALRILGTGGAYNLGVYNNSFTIVYGAQSIIDAGTNSYTHAVSLLNLNGMTHLKNLVVDGNNHCNESGSASYRLYVSGQSYMTYAGDILKLASTNTYSCINYSQSSGAGWSVGSNSSNQFYFYNTSKGASYTYIDINGSIYTHGWVHLNRANSGTDNGLTFYGNDSNYSIMFRQTSNLGTHESVSGDWAMYFNMSNSSTRGWIFRRWGSKNVASLSCHGRLWVGIAGDTETERQIGVASGAGKLYMYSSAATTSGRGMYTPAHGTGTARSVFSLDTNNRVYFADSYNGTQTALAYSQAGMAYNAITWMTCWNGYELRAINAAAVRQFLFGAAAIGNNIRPVYWNGSTLANTDFYRIQYDGSEDWASYKYHRVAYVNSPGAYADIWIRLAITSGDTASRVGELYLRYRTGSGRLYEAAEISWITKTTGINLNHFKLLYFNNNPSSGVSKCEFWVEIPGRWGGYGFKVIDSGSSRANSGILGWTFDADNTGHGSASLPSATGTVTSYLAPLTGYWANLGIQTAPSTTTSPTFSTCYTSNWFRSTGNSGWYSESYGGGWYMIDSTWIRNYGSKSIYLNVGSASGLAMGTNGRVAINGTSASYPLHVYGDSYATGWSRAGSGFYCEGYGVHYTHKGTYGEIYTSSNNVFNFTTGSWTTLYFNYGSNKFGNTYVTNFIWNAGSSTTYAQHTLGNLYTKGVIYLTSHQGSWVSGMSTNPSIWYRDGNAIDASSYWAMYAMKSSAGNVINFGGLGDRIGFYGYYAGRTANSTDWNFTVNTSNGIWASSKRIDAYGFYHTSYGSAYWVNRTDGSAAKFDYSSKNSSRPTYVWGWAADNDYRLYNVAYIDTHYTANLYVGSASTASNSAVTNPYLKLYENSTLRNQYQIKGSGTTTVSSDSSGNITINSSGGGISGMTISNNSSTTKYLWGYNYTSGTTSTVYTDSTVYSSGGHIYLTNGNMYVGSTSNTAERQIICRSSAGTLYMYSQGSSSGNRGLYGLNSSNVSHSIITAKSNNKCYFHGHLAPIGFGDGTSMTNNCAFTYYGTDGSFYGNSGWCHYLICNHGDGSSYYNYVIGLPFWDPPMYKRQTGSTSSVTQWFRFYTEENLKAGTNVTITWDSSANAYKINASGGGSSVTLTTTNTSNHYVIGVGAGSIPSNGSSVTSVYARSEFYFTNTGAYHTSDIRKKYDIRDILNDDVNRLFETENGFIRHFKWISTNEDAYGFIAQELQEYCPEAVDFNNDDGYYSVNYNVAFSKIIGAMFKKIKEQEQIINKLQRKMEVS